MRRIDDIDKLKKSYNAYLMHERGLADNTRMGYSAD